MSVLTIIVNTRKSPCGIREARMKGALLKTFRHLQERVGETNTLVEDLYIRRCPRHKMKMNMIIIGRLRQIPNGPCVASSEKEYSLPFLLCFSE